MDGSQDLLETWLAYYHEEERVVGDTRNHTCWGIQVKSRCIDGFAYFMKLKR